MSDILKLIIFNIIHVSYIYHSLLLSLLIDKTYFMVFLLLLSIHYAWSIDAYFCKHWSCCCWQIISRNFGASLLFIISRISFSFIFSLGLTSWSSLNFFFSYRPPGWEFFLVRLNEEKFWRPSPKFYALEGRNVRLHVPYKIILITRRQTHTYIPKSDSHAEGNRTQVRQDAPQLRAMRQTF